MSSIIISGTFRDRKGFDAIAEALSDHRVVEEDFGPVRNAEELASVIMSRTSEAPLRLKAAVSGASLIQLRLACHQAGMDYLFTSGDGLHAGGMREIFARSFRPTAVLLSVKNGVASSETVLRMLKNGELQMAESYLRMTADPEASIAQHFAPSYPLMKSLEEDFAPATVPAP